MKMYVLLIISLLLVGCGIDGKGTRSEFDHLCKDAQSQSQLGIAILDCIKITQGSATIGTDDIIKTCTRQLTDAMCPVWELTYDYSCAFGVCEYTNVRTKLIN